MEEAKESDTRPLVYQESTVGAGLPVISTLKDLVATGDRIHKIEGVLSGTMSYIFNEFSPASGSTTKFSEIVSVARQNGYTEPHPGDDLSGSDVARKLTICLLYTSDAADDMPYVWVSLAQLCLSSSQLCPLSLLSRLWRCKTVARRSSPRQVSIWR